MKELIAEIIDILGDINDRIYLLESDAEGWGYEQGLTIRLRVLR